MDWCETNDVGYVFGLVRNQRLEREIAPAKEEARLSSGASGRAARVFRDFRWSTKDNWTRRRRVVGNAEWTLLGAYPRASYRVSSGP